jgi:transcriptional regulator with XRE-family HTH domain
MATTPKNVVGPQVRRLRTAAGLSQSALAGACQRLGWDVGRDAIAKIEAGTRWVADVELLELAKVLACPMAALFPARAQSIIRGARG